METSLCECSFIQSGMSPNKIFSQMCMDMHIANSQMDI